MAANTNRKTARSIRKDQAQREPAGRLAAGGSGVERTAVSAGAVTVGSRLGESQFAGLGIIVKNLGVASPLDGGFELTAGFFLAEVLIEQIAEKVLAERAVGLGLEGLFHLPEQRHVGEGGLAEDGFAGLNVGLGEGIAFRRDDGIALLHAKQTQENRGVDRGQKRLQIHTEFLRQAM